MPLNIWSFLTISKDPMAKSCAWLSMCLFPFTNVEMLLCLGCFLCLEYVSTGSSLVMFRSISLVFGASVATSILDVIGNCSRFLISWCLHLSPDWHFLIESFLQTTMLRTYIHIYTYIQTIYIISVIYSK